jgi:hypothetical protein
VREAIAVVAAAVVALWGVAHAIPTKSVVAGFGAISTDNRWIITQEWLAEALTMWFIAAVVIVATLLGEPENAATEWIYRASAAALLAVGTLTALTGARTGVIWFKICPVLLSATAAALLVASFI